LTKRPLRRGAATRYASSTSRVCCLLVVVALTGCGQSGPTSGEPQSEAGPGIADLHDCDLVREYYVDGMTTAKYVDGEDEAEAISLARKLPDGCTSWVALAYPRHRVRSASVFRAR
jgi:hypothetical protein